MGVPRIKAVRQVARTRFFAIEEIDLVFANGVERTYERMPGVGTPAVMVVAVNHDDELVLIREYCAGFHEMQLTLVKGAAEDEEPLEDAANRELREEAGLAARNIRFVKRLNLAPGHMGFTINVMLATGLYPSPLPADEPEPPEVVYWPLARLDDLIAGNEFQEARAIAALCLARPLLNQLPKYEQRFVGAVSSVCGSGLQRLWERSPAAVGAVSSGCGSGLPTANSRSGDRAPTEERYASRQNQPPQRR